uniref:Sulfur globule protein CV1 n=1 Tax=Candidatus Kentrum sp. FM TaxID=2126340 RepID=A0A450TXZ4_9GAMM|nr:MAG: hypothetical protein BECKFM1743C_GA0114222_101612 [Candidatus Kentron sp. FM]VFJ74215.1 MAG: hypothetical protein BECKFM1743A_GA0114220_107651 [Candidatus Kentron sp. FM]VFK12825.1 MAG: hypothetical protein BECKFM1743B_GA0114221_102562 [Candidatus Kentron sp. FM]
MKLVSKTIAAALIAGASALPMQSANAFWMTPDGYGSFGPWNWSEYGMSNRGGPWGGGYGYGGGYGGGYGYGGHYGHGPYGGGWGGAPYGGGYGFPFYGYGAPYYPAAPAPAAPAKAE